MLFRALLAFLALPAVFGGLLPWLLLRGRGWRLQGSILGWPILLFGLGILLWCAGAFYVIGKGTLAPWDPPRKLVIVGPYRFMRNPMYVGVLCLVAGWSIIAGSPVLAAYCGILAIGFHLRVVSYEEPTLARKFGREWMEYSAAVNRWLPRLTSKVDS